MLVLVQELLLHVPPLEQVLDVEGDLFFIVDFDNAVLHFLDIVLEVGEVSDERLVQDVVDVVSRSVRVSDQHVGESEGNHRSIQVALKGLHELLRRHD